MAKKVTAEQAQSMAAMFSAMRGDSEAAQANLEKMLASQSRGVRSLERQFKKLRVANIKEIRNAEEAIKKLRDNFEDLDDAEKRQLETLVRSRDEYKKVNAGILNLATSTKETSSWTGAFSRSIQDALAPLKEYADIHVLLSRAVDGVIEVYREWWRQQEVTTAAMGTAQRALGGSATQMAALEEASVGLRDTFFNLEGAVDGIAISIEEVTGIAAASRTAVTDMEDGFVGSIMRMGRALAGGTENAVMLSHMLDSGLMGGTATLEDFGGEMARMAESIGANAGQMVVEFADARNEIARFGSDGAEVFGNATTMARSFGIETGRVLRMMKGFDTFSGASQNVNQLNAMLGTTLSSYEMMMTEDPSERLQMLRTALSDAGQNFDTMSRQGRDALAAITGEDTETLSRIFSNESGTLEELRAAAEQRAADSQDDRSNTEMMNDLLRATGTVIRGWREQIKQMWVHLAQKVAPIFEVIHRNAEEIWTAISAWWESLGSDDTATRWIDEVANTIQEMFTYVRGQNWVGMWNRVKDAWRTLTPYIDRAGTWIGEMVDKVGQADWAGMWDRVVTTWEGWLPSLERAGIWIGEMIQKVIDTDWVGMWGRVVATWNEWAPVIERVFSYIRTGIDIAIAGARVLWSIFESIADVLIPIGNFLSQGSSRFSTMMPRSVVAAHQEKTPLQATLRNMIQEDPAIPTTMTTIPGSAMESAGVTARTANSSATGARNSPQIHVSTAPVIIKWNGREFGKGQIETALRTT